MTVCSCHDVVWEPVLRLFAAYASSIRSLIRCKCGDMCSLLGTALRRPCPAVVRLARSLAIVEETDSLDDSRPAQAACELMDRLAATLDAIDDVGCVTQKCKPKEFEHRGMALIRYMNSCRKVKAKGKPD